jgi:predicted ATP-binding protein involved in virulence
MTDVFITKIEIHKVRHLENCSIELSDTERKHLIITGQNGSGKTSVLEQILNGLAHDWPVGKNKIAQLSYPEETVMRVVNTISIDLNSENRRDSVLLFISARRTLDIEVPKHIETININRVFGIEENASKDFLKYMIDLDYQKLSAGNNGNNADKERIEKWFIHFTKTLSDIYDDPNLGLYIDAKTKIAEIKTENRETFGLHQMADGYSALLKIVMELMMRMDSKVDGAYDIPGIALIDEIETHLHVELQKKVLPFLTTLFPNIQFIVTTHSPFVIESLKGAVVYDLERQERNIITEAKTANETVREMLGVPITMPVWAEQNLNTIIEKYMSENIDEISFEDMKKELEAAGLSSFFPETMSKVLRGAK